jgi:hypothetical protein
MLEEPSMARFDTRISRPTLTASLSVLLHVGLFLLLTNTSGRNDGVQEREAPLPQLVFLERHDTARRETVDATRSMPVARVIDPPARLPQFEPPEPIPEQPKPAASNALTSAHAVEAAAIEPRPSTASFAVTPTERSLLLHRLANITERLGNVSEARIEWAQDARHYSVILIVQRAQDASALDRVVADVRTENQGRPVFTRLTLKRMAFSNFVQLVDRWDPLVQLHDDEIDGRMHFNSQFNLMHDQTTAPKLLGKVTTAARRFNTESRSSRREYEIFRGGIETRAGRIPLPEHFDPLAWTARDGNARTHACANDTRILFFGDGSYLLRDLDTRTSRYVASTTDGPIYFIGEPDVTLYVKGIVKGKILIYSPKRIVIEGNLTYARDPRRARSHDMLGLVSDGTVQIAPAHVTGRGDLEIHAAIFARRRFTVTDIDHPRAGTLHIFGSLTAGTLSATEPRYATKLDYDSRFEAHRPPGFPSTNRYALEQWDEKWMEVPDSRGERLASGED